MKKIFAIIGSTRVNSSNLRLIKYFSKLSNNLIEIEVFEELSKLPHFNPDLDNENPPEIINTFREKISLSDGVIICTPEYVFSIPGSLKNSIEWCVSTTIFSKKPLGLITASASGEKAHDELKLIMKTLEANFTENTTLLIKGIKSKFDASNNIIDENLIKNLNSFLKSYMELFT